MSLVRQTATQLRSALALAAKRYGEPEIGNYRGCLMLCFREDERAEHMFLWGELVYEYTRPVFGEPEMVGVYFSDFGSIDAACEYCEALALAQPAQDSDEPPVNAPEPAASESPAEPPVTDNQKAGEDARRRAVRDEMARHIRQRPLWWRAVAQARAGDVCPECLGTGERDVRDFGAHYETVPCYCAAGARAKRTARRRSPRFQEDLSPYLGRLSVQRR